MILFVSAWEPEQRILCSLASGASSPLLGTPPLPLVEAELGLWQRLQTYPELTQRLGSALWLRCGVGPIRAAAAVSRQLAIGPVPEALFFVGTAGAYPKQGAPPPGSACAVASVEALDAAELEGRGYVPAGHGMRLSSEDPEAVYRCANPASITSDAFLAERFGRNCELENLELAGCAHAAREAGIPWRAWLGIANAVGPSAHREWHEQHLAASAAAQEACARFLLGPRSTF